MSAAPRLRTKRLLLRRWRTGDLEPCAAMNAEPAVVEHLPGPYSRAGSAAFIAEMEQFATRAKEAFRTYPA